MREMQLKYVRSQLGGGAGVRSQLGGGGRQEPAGWRRVVEGSGASWMEEGEM